MPDLRGYGDSSKPPDGENHANYSKRAMALDQVEVMKHFGFDKFPVIGHDRGGRVGHRLALDHADKVTRLAVLDIVPTHYLYTHVTLEFIQAYFHWFNYVRAAPGPEEQLKAQYEQQAAKATTPVQREYARVYGDMADIHGMCEDYRAGASIDLTARRRRPAEEDRLPAAGVVGRQGADGPALRRAGDLARAGDDGHRQGDAGGPQHPGGRAGGRRWPRSAPSSPSRAGTARLAPPADHQQALRCQTPPLRGGDGHRDWH